MPTRAELALTYSLHKCPFCGRSRIAVLAFNPSAARYDRGWFVAHGGKGCVLSGAQSRGYKAPDLAAAAWNRRAPVVQAENREGGQP